MGEGPMQLVHNKGDKHMKGPEAGQTEKSQDNLGISKPWEASKDY